MHDWYEWQSLMDVIYCTCSEVDSYCFAGIPFAGPPWLYSTLRLWNHRGESYELATTPGCLLFQQQKSRGPPTPQKFIIRISPISDWVWQKSSRKIRIITKNNKKVSFLPSPPPLANPIWPMAPTRRPPLLGVATGRTLRPWVREPYVGSQAHIASPYMSTN